jgi:hypothetical protein
MVSVISLGRIWILTAALLGTGCAGHCGALGGLPPERPPILKGPDGSVYHLVGRGPYKAFYDRWGRLQRLEYDQNGDGRADRIAHYDGTRFPRTIEVDEDFDGVFDRWEDYDDAGRLVKVGTSRRGHGPDMWTALNQQGEPVRREYDDDGDGRPERFEYLQRGQVIRVELDTDRDGRIDRWQEWRAGRLISEEVDTDGDGRPDQRIRYGEGGNVLGLEAIASR